MREIIIPNHFNAGKLKGCDILSFQIMPEHVHLMAWKIYPDHIDNVDRTLENVRSVLKTNVNSSPKSTLSRVRTITRIRSDSFNISNLLQSIKGNFSREIHQGNIWQKRFYTRIINNQKYLQTIIEYIKQNPVKSELPEKYHKMPYQYFSWPAIRKLF
ncbi:MAG: hypothetical protein COY66_00910 [Candidatus Kerfeldbacteria bacterium CG_4_10_14_0_8_um_filter_42_10]|uniref:Transposase IS200-like domain-containing protein n=1 Tax=Candidatus Kerfeldbacteria bacterium CG_4_10_14_0_8_um_filter_42_10 TaxID=2014248 RepID=A0A2M7RKP3_9BACT|nr:MAG: hypothetical protein COY66_00910 [Candidatus Kerfeldbacteria bacterium CG_4_10_14_0_8_um_filter_42_10]